MTDHDEERLSRALHDRAADMTGAPIDLEDVQRTARGIRRRRRVTGGLVAAAVVAVAVPVGLGMTGTTRADRPVTPATTSPSGSPEESATPSTATSPSLPQPEGVTPLTVHGAPDGAPAAITYLRGSTAVVPGADPVDLPAAYDTIAPYRGGWLAVERRQGTTYVVHIDASGTVTSSENGGERIAVSQDGIEVSWVESDRLYLDTTNGHSEQPQQIAVPEGVTASPVGFVSPGRVVAQVEGPEDSYWVTDFTDFTVVPGVLTVSATAERTGVLGVQTSYDNDNGTSCWALRTSTGGGPGNTVARTCSWQVTAFSPSGAHFAGFPSDSDGPGSASVGLLDAKTAGRVVSFDRQGDADTYVADVVWEDDSHALASLHETDAWYLVRLGLDGSLEKLDEAPGAPEDSPFRFAAHP